ncbi:hypothetical protein [Granulicella sp. S190]|nr:hypothetical protein [Granulicella sp. S190]
MEESDRVIDMAVCYIGSIGLPFSGRRKKPETSAYRGGVSGLYFS